MPASWNGCGAMSCESSASWSSRWVASMTCMTAGGCSSPRSPARMLAIWVDHLVLGSEEHRLAGGRAGRTSSWSATPTWTSGSACARRPWGSSPGPKCPAARTGRPGVCRRLGWGGPGEGWRRVIASVDSFADLEPQLVGAVEMALDARRCRTSRRSMKGRPDGVAVAGCSRREPSSAITRVYGPAARRAAARCGRGPRIWRCCSRTSTAVSVTTTAADDSAPPCSRTDLHSRPRRVGLAPLQTVGSVDELVEALSNPPGMTPGHLGVAPGPGCRTRSPRGCRARRATVSRSSPWIRRWRSCWSLRWSAGGAAPRRRVALAFSRPAESASSTPGAPRASSAGQPVPLRHRRPQRETSSSPVSATQMSSSERSGSRRIPCARSAIGACRRFLRDSSARWCTTGTRC